MTTELKPGDKAPAFRLETTGGTRRLKDFAGSHLVLYFYPKDDTPGCTLEAQDFTAHANAFREAGAVVLGVSRDALTRHGKFAAKYKLDVLLGSDEAGDVSDAYGTWEEKSMYGRTYMGMARRTFLIGPTGKIVRIWPKVKVKGHAEDVLAAIGD
ncbi:MAG: peroxiredoxin [Hyphomonas sp.]|uniref:peroxiredoxin n=1 Tax=Hyphomonas sp. TaxID=87 RepID=UPI0018244647|nr:peroxiredoxin [Hyphomonas sp.]MBU3920765.1 peroxiredoxin [Alphaproteobacteria bacterium]MBA3068015.1 peroxiredoxin [Hyphomonas sp.]MBU4061353.1 peroxiredoxin [Alphaproteobacteria bacterium]MBU4162606.1 peroxiredoxin [Alphaproteobacteria bacterium]MBU4568333.1 peroxiredoxin [Alphaproteobacteria bacterium]